MKRLTPSSVLPPQGEEEESAAPANLPEVSNLREVFCAARPEQRLFEPVLTVQLRESLAGIVNPRASIRPPLRCGLLSMLTLLVSGNTKTGSQESILSRCRT